MTKQEPERYIDVYGRDIYSFCRHVTGSVQEADELYLDTWLKAVERWKIMDPSENVKAFCMLAALRLRKNKKRKYAWRKRIAEFRTTETESGEEYLKNRLPSAEEQILEEVLPKKGWRIWCWKLLS